MKPYTCLSTRMDVAALLTEGYSLCRRSRRLGWKCPEAQAVPSFFPTTLTSGVKGTLRAITCLFLFFFWLGTRRAHKCSSAPLYQDLRKTRNGPVPLPVSVFECNWLMSRLPGKMASVIFIQRLPGASCFSLGPCVAMATPAVQSVQRKHSRPS